MKMVAVATEMAIPTRPGTRRMHITITTMMGRSRMGLMVKAPRNASWMPSATVASYALVSTFRPRIV